MGQLEDGTMKMRVTQPMDRDGLISSSVGVAWQASKSQVLGTPSSAAVQLNTPRILELDVNRMMIGQTDVRYIVITFIQTPRATFIWLLSIHCWGTVLRNESSERGRNAGISCNWEVNWRLNLEIISVRNQDLLLGNLHLVISHLNLMNTTPHYFFRKWQHCT